MSEKLDIMSLFSYSVITAISVAIIIIFICYYVCFGKKPSAYKRKVAFSKRHVLITGGSSGIGKSMALEAARRGSNVTIIARDANKLKSAKEEIIKACDSQLQRVKTLSCDVSTISYEDLEKMLTDVEEELGPIFMLINCAGSSVCGKMEDLSVTDFKHMMDLNYMGSVLPTKAVIGGMKSRGSGHVIFIASQAAMLGIFGYTAYSSSKFALRGLAEALYMEAKPFGITVTVALPPDTDTPGFAEEEKAKITETREICQASGLMSADLVALRVLDDAIDGKFYSFVGLEGFIQKTLCVGMAPVTSFCELISEVFLMGLMRFISTFYLLSFERIVQKCMKNKDSAKKSM
uniref:3-dehydrosphinganine reductase n=2 Tax=Clastoptera arizonana TaxID=38151 RepID=A0A1B6CKZ1_9HEMI